MKEGKDEGGFAGRDSDWRPAQGGELGHDALTGGAVDKRRHLFARRQRLPNVLKYSEIVAADLHLTAHRQDI